MKFFGPPTTIWRPWIVFGKFNENYLLMANIFKLYKCQTFVLLKMHNMRKIWFLNNKFSLWISSVYNKRVVENAIFNFFFFFFFHFSKFQMTIAKNLMKKNPFLRWISRVVKFCYVLIVFDIHTFDNETNGLFKIFWNFYENGFCFFIFSRWKKYFNLTLTCCCANLNSGSLNKHYLRAV